MACILCVSYDESFLKKLELLLDGMGHRVASAHGFTAALKECATGDFDLFILGDSIPTAHKEALIGAFRSRCPAPVMVLRGANEREARGADYETDAEPQNVVELVARIISVNR